MDVRFPEMAYRGMENLLQIRVSERMKALGMNAYETAIKAGLGGDFVRDLMRGKKRSISAENLSKLAEVLGTSPDYFSGLTPSPEIATLPDRISGLVVQGVIQAGHWLDASIVGEEMDHEIVPVAKDPRFPRAKQYALVVAGDSMDLEYPEGSYVTCVDFADSGIVLREGLTVHVERHNGSLVEVTLKVIEKNGVGFILCPRSSNQRHKPLHLEGDDGTEIVVKGIVTGSYRRTVI